MSTLNSTATSTQMLLEAREAPEAVARQLQHSTVEYQRLGEALRAAGGDSVRSVLTIARGSSDHAAHFMAYLIMARLGKLVTSLPMSLITLYRSQIETKGLAALAFSQSGQSPDLIEPIRYFTANNALTAAFVNDEHSPLAAASRWVFPLCAGAEKSVAATKSFIAQLVAGARLVASWEENAELTSALAQLPSTLRQAAHLDWSPAVESLAREERLFVIGRGTGLAVAMEAALKFKETCAIQAEAFSAAEVKHGPMALIGEGYPLLIFAARGPSQAGLIALAEEMRARKANVWLAAPLGTPGADLPLATTGSELLDPIAAIQSFYPMVEALARARGYDPDRPRFLAKVTKTN